jgi:hypothetical protein
VADPNHSVSSARADLAAALNDSAGVREIKVGKSALRKLVAQAEELLAPDEHVEFGAYYYERGLTMVTYYLILVSDRRVMRVNRTTWKLKPWISERESISSVEISSGARTPRVTLRRGDAVVAPFELMRGDAERLAELVAPRQS